MGGPKTQDNKCVMDIHDCLVSHSSWPDVPVIPKTAVDAYLYLLQNSKYCDVAFIVGKEQKKIHCHCVFLMARSAVFETALRCKLNGAKPIQIVVNDVSPDLFGSFLKFIYGDFLDATATDPLLQLLELGLKYKVELLSEKCISEMCSSDMTPEDAIKMLYAAEKFKLGQLRASAIDKLVTSLGTLAKEPELLVRLDEPVVTCFLQRNDLPLEEVEVFNFLVNWGKTRIKVQDNLQELRDTLGPLLPLIRFPIMSPAEFGGCVASAGLLPSKTLIQLFIYFTAIGDPWEMAARSLEYSTKPRDGFEETVEAEASFYSSEHHLGKGRTETCAVACLRECIRFTVNYPPSSKVPPVKTKVLLNSIIIQWPKRLECCQGTSSDFVSETEKSFAMAGPNPDGRIDPPGPKKRTRRLRNANSFYKVNSGRGMPIYVNPNSNENKDTRVSNNFTNEPGSQLQGFRSNYGRSKQFDSPSETPVDKIQNIFQTRPFSSASFNPLFRIHLKEIVEQPEKESGGPVASIVTQFVANSLVMKEGEVVSIEVNPPVELFDGKQNLLLLEEESFIPFSSGQYRYAAAGNLQNSVEVKLKDCTLEISDIYRNDPKPFGSVADKFSDVPVIKTLNITYAISTPKVAYS